MTIRIKRGTKQYCNKNHHPERQTGLIWSRRDTVVADDIELDGYVHVRCRLVTIGGHTRKCLENVTCRRGECRTGVDIDWLLTFINKGE